MAVQPGQDWDGDNNTGPLDRPTQRRFFAQVFFAFSASAAAMRVAKRCRTQKDLPCHSSAALS
jgi:hypothetical protein